MTRYSLQGSRRFKEKYNDMILETKRLILRPFTENDAADAFEYLHEPMVHCFACMKTETMEDARKAVLERAKDGEYYFAITLKENGKVIG